MVVIAPVRPSRIRKKPAPNGETIIGSTTDSENSIATAASTAFPPEARISAPTAAASGWLATAIAVDAVTGRRRAGRRLDSGSTREQRPLTRRSYGRQPAAGGGRARARAGRSGARARRGPGTARRGGSVRR